MPGDGARGLAARHRRKLYPELMLTGLHATERKPPKGREEIDWRPMTDLSVSSRHDAIEKLQWYALR